LADAARVQKRPRRKWLLMLLVALSGLAVLGAALRERPQLAEAAQRRTYLPDDAFNATLRQVNQQMAERIAARGFEPAEPAGEFEICRRVSLALVGCGLSLEELRTLEQIEPGQRVAWWTWHLLSSRRWSDYFSERIARACVGTNQGPFLLFRRRRFNSWLSDQLAAGVGYDRIAREMVSGDGLWTDTPGTNFITATMDETQNGRADPVRLAGRTSRAFLALRIDCVQCHDDVLQKLDFGSLAAPVPATQAHFHSLAAFYAGTRVADPAFRGIVDDGRAYRFQYLGAAEEETVEPQVPFRPDLLPAGDKPRKRLAQWLTHPENRQFARAAVNRIWALVFGTALVEPVDDIPLGNEVPPELDRLADDFVAHGYDLRRLVMLIVSTAAFQRSSRAGFDVTPEHEQVWAVYPMVPLRPEQIAGSVIQACSLTPIDRNASILAQLKAFGETNDFLRAFGDRGEDEFSFDSVTVPQRLLMMNGKLVSEGLKQDLVGSAATQIALLVQDDAQAVELAFRTILNRLPTPREREVFEPHLDGKRAGRRAQAVADIAWALLNSTEFSWNH
jgi:hypothetical protein